MVATTEQDKVVEIRRPIVGDPMLDVAGVAPRLGTVAAGEPAAGITNCQRPALHSRYKSGLAPHI
jgi:hypothetical protein